MEQANSLRKRKISTKEPSGSKKACPSSIAECLGSQPHVEAGATALPRVNLVSRGLEAVTRVYGEVIKALAEVTKVYEVLARGEPEETIVNNEQEEQDEPEEEEVNQESIAPTDGTSDNEMEGEEEPEEEVTAEVSEPTDRNGEGRHTEQMDEEQEPEEEIAGEEGRDTEQLEDGELKEEEEAGDLTQVDVDNENDDQPLEEEQKEGEVAEKGRDHEQLGEQELDEEELAEEVNGLDGEHEQERNIEPIEEEELGEEDMVEEAYQRDIHLEVMNDGGAAEVPRNSVADPCDLRPEAEWDAKTTSLMQTLPEELRELLSTRAVALTDWTASVCREHNDFYMLLRMSHIHPQQESQQPFTSSISVHTTHDEVPAEGNSECVTTSTVEEEHEMRESGDQEEHSAERAAALQEAECSSAVVRDGAEIPGPSSSSDYVIPLIILDSSDDSLDNNDVAFRRYTVRDAVEEVLRDNGGEVHEFDGHVADDRARLSPPRTQTPHSSTSVTAQDIEVSEGGVDDGSEAKNASNIIMRRNTRGTGPRLCAKCGVHGVDNLTCHSNCKYRDCVCPEGCGKVQSRRDKRIRVYKAQKEKKRQESEAVAGPNGGDPPGPRESRSPSPDNEE